MKVRVKRGSVVTLCGNDIFLPIARPDPTVILASPHNGSTIFKLKALELAIAYAHSTAPALAIEICRTMTGIAIETFCLRSCSDAHTELHAVNKRENGGDNAAFGWLVAPEEYNQATHRNPVVANNSAEVSTTVTRSQHDVSFSITVNLPGLCR